MSTIKVFGAKVIWVRGSQALVLLEKSTLVPKEEVEFTNSTGDQVAVGRVVKVGKKKARVKVTLGRARRGNKVARLVTGELGDDEEELQANSSRPKSGLKLGIAGGVGQVLGTDFEVTPFAYKLNFIMAMGQWVSKMELFHWFGTEELVETKWTSAALGLGWEYAISKFKIEPGIWVGLAVIDVSFVKDNFLHEEKIENGFAGLYLAFNYAFIETVEVGAEIRNLQVLDGTEIKGTTILLHTKVFF